MGVVPAPTPLRTGDAVTTLLPEGIHELSRSPVPPYHHDDPRQSLGPHGIVPLDELLLGRRQSHALCKASFADSDGQGGLSILSLPRCPPAIVDGRLRDGGQGGGRHPPIEVKTRARRGRS
jgi:hypothetical protein